MSYRVMKEFTTPRHRWRAGAMIEAGDIDGRMTVEQMLEIGVLQEISPRRTVPKMPTDAMMPPEPDDHHAHADLATDKDEK